MSGQFKSLRPDSVAETVIDGKRIRFFVPNKSALWRCETLLSKEPATIDWLRELRPDDVLVDVGANVGMYTVFSAALMGARVYAFEPESQNFALLMKNVILNGLQDRVVSYPAAVSDTGRLDKLYLSGFEWDGAGSLHTFSSNVGHDLRPRSSSIVQGAVSIALDEAVQSGSVPLPRFIKIDVDGFEHKVISGALKTLGNPAVESVCVEINTNLAEHNALFDVMRNLGYQFDQAQLDRSMRREGAFRGCCEVIFRRSAVPRLEVQAPFQSNGTAPDSEHEAAFNHVLAKVSACPLQTDPYPLAIVDNVFPPDYYAEALRHFPARELLSPLSETGRTSGSAYQERNVLLFDPASFAKLPSAQRAFWSGFASWLYSEKFIAAVVGKFLPWCRERLLQLSQPDGRVRVRSDALLVDDRTRYAIGPHTDAPHRLISFLFYLPADNKYVDLGTSIYRAKDPGFVCPGGPHYDFANFDRVAKIDFIPNRLVMFVRTGRSFHGVEPIAREGVERHLLINNVRLIDVR